MAMQTQLWSINALSNELNMDRRTLAKKLAGLPPVETKEIDERIEKRWHLADVIDYLNRPERTRSQDTNEELNNLLEHLHHTLHITAIQHFAGHMAAAMWPEYAAQLKEAGLGDEKIIAMQKDYLAEVMQTARGYISEEMFCKFLQEVDETNLDKMIDLEYKPPLQAASN